MKQAVHGFANTAPEANAIIEALRARGFPDSDISVLFPDRQDPHRPERSTKAPEAAAAGGVAGIGVGGALGLLAGFGALGVPGVAPLLAVGPLVAALSGATVGGATGGIIGGLVGIGHPEFRARRRVVNRAGRCVVKKNAGGILISVHSDNGRARLRAKRILARAGARHVGVR